MGGGPYWSKVSFGWLALATIWRVVSGLNLTLTDLPVPGQQSHRVLAVMTSSDPVQRQWYLDKQLHSYAEMCEMGFEVHVFLVTFKGQQDNLTSLDHTIFEPRSRHYCQRLSMALPVAAGLFEGLSARHREIFSQKADLYDYFISQEDDILLRPHNLLYYTRWLHFFEQVKGLPEPVVPAFLLYEVFMQNITTSLSGTNATGNSGTDKLRWHHPATLIHLYHERAMTLLDIGGVPCVAFQKSYAATYVISQRILKMAMSKKAWTRDASVQWREYNVHFQGIWLSHYFKVAIPLQALRHSMLHHGPDKYTPPLVEDSNKFDDTSNHVADLAEIRYLIENCTGIALNHSRVEFHYPSLSPDRTTINYESPGSDTLSKEPAPCSVCAKQGKAARLTFDFMGPSLAAQPLKPTSHFHSQVTCTDWIQTQMLEPCTGGNTTCWDQLSPA